MNLVNIEKKHVLMVSAKRDSIDGRSLNVLQWIFLSDSEEVKDYSMLHFNLLPIVLFLYSIAKIYNSCSTFKLVYVMILANRMNSFCTKMRFKGLKHVKKKSRSGNVSPSKERKKKGEKKKGMCRLNTKSSGYSKIKFYELWQHTLKHDTLSNMHKVTDSSCFYKNKILKRLNIII